MTGKLPRVTAKQAVRALEKAGFVLVRSSGSHQHFRHPDRAGLVTVPAHAGETLYPALLKSVLRKRITSGRHQRRRLQGTFEMTRRYTVLLEWDADGQGYAVSVPALPGCFTQGATVPEALERARHAISGHIAALVEIGEPVPMEGSPALLTVVEIDDIALVGD